MKLILSPTEAHTLVRQQLKLSKEVVIEIQDGQPPSPPVRSLRRVLPEEKFIERLDEDSDELCALDKNIAALVRHLDTCTNKNACVNALVIESRNSLSEITAKAIVEDWIRARQYFIKFNRIPFLTWNDDKIESYA